MLRVLMTWLADRLESGGRLQRPDVGVEGDIPLSFYTDAKTENERAWVGGFPDSSAKPGLWFSLEVTRDWAPCVIPRR